MKTFILIAAVAITGIAAQGFVRTNHVVKASGKKTSIAPEVASFDAVEISFPMHANIVMKEGATPGIQVSGDENVLSYLKTKVRNHTLVIYCDNNLDFENGAGALATITMPELTDLTLSSSERAEISGNLKGNKFHLDIAGSGSVSIDNLNVANFESEISGSGNIAISGGAVNSASYEISGSGRIRAYPLQAKSVSANISGSGRTEVSASEKISVEISGSGNIRYKGRPEIVKQDISGSGELRHED